MFYRVQRLANNLSVIRTVFDLEIEKRYGFHYSDKDIDGIIDCLDYGSGELSFTEFKKLLNLHKDDDTY